MIERVGQVLYWAITAVTLALVGYGIWSWYAGEPLYEARKVMVAALIIWLGGRICLYILAGR